MEEIYFQKIEEIDDIEFSNYISIEYKKYPRPQNLPYINYDKFKMTINKGKRPGIYIEVYKLIESNMFDEFIAMDLKDVTIKYHQKY